MKKTLEKLKRNEHVTIVAFGDSNTEQTWHTYGRLNWVGLLQEALFERYGRNTATVINSGKCGDTAQDALARVERDVVRFKPDLVLIGFGINDSRRGHEGLDGFRSAMTELIARCRAASGADVLLRTPNPIVQLSVPDPSITPGDAITDDQLSTYVQAIVEIADANQAEVVDHHKAWCSTTRPSVTEDWNHLAIRMSDAIHPGPVGHLCFYRELAPYFDLPERFCWE